MERKCFIISIALAFVLGCPATAADLTVTRISVTGTETTDPELVRAAFLEVKVGDALDETVLQAVAQAAQNRLTTLGYFSSVEVLVIRSKAKPGTAALVAEVTEGFTGRYGGGPIWGRFGAVNLGGRAQDVDLWLGWNRQAVGWSGRWAGAPGWTVGAEGGNRPRPWTGVDGHRREDHAVGASASITKDWGWGWATGASFGADQVFDPGYGTTDFQLQPRGWVEWSRRGPEYSPPGPLVRLESVLLPGNAARFGADLRATLPLGGFKAAFRGVGWAQTGTAAAREDLVLGDLGFRKVYDASDRGATALWASAELRWPTVFDLGFTSLALEPALVVDIGPVWAAGAALRAYVGAPILLPLDLEVTYDQDHRFWLGFSASAPY